MTTVSSIRLSRRWIKDTEGSRSMVKASRLYSPYRAIGYITDGAPFCVNRLGEATFITTTIGNAFQVFEHERLRISLVSPPKIEGGSVIGLAAQGSRTYVATEECIQVWERVSLKETLSPEPRGRYTALLVVGEVLMALDDSGLLRIWSAKTLQLEGEVEVRGEHQFGARMLHPHTYLNKILVGDSGGRLSLWNVRSKKLVHSLTLEGQAKGAAITALEQSPAIDVVAVGRADGTIQLVHLRYDKVLFTLKQDRVAVTSLAFRTDTGSQDVPMLASGGQDGQIHVWDLKTHRLHSVIGGHGGAVSSLYFFAREPLLLSSSRDNSLRMWVFDGADGSARLLKSREGHTAPPRRIRYYGSHTLASMGSGADATGCQILSAGSDRSFRVFNTARDAQSRELSQGPLLKKARKLHVAVEELRLPPILSFAAVETRSRDWANVITCHEGHSHAYVWKFDQRVIGQVVLRQPDWASNALGSVDVPQHHATCVSVSNCGNYGLVGTRGGVVYMYNMQSGEPRGAFPKHHAAVSKPHESVTLNDGKRARPGSVWSAFKAIVGQPKKRPRSDGDSQLTTVEAPVAQGHTGVVTGVEVDSLNSVVISSSLDGTLRFWDFKSGQQIDVVQVGVGVSSLELARDSDLLAAACDDFVIRIYDITTRKLVRRLTGHTAALTDLGFSRDGRRLVTASVDASLRIWDLPTGSCVDWLSFERAVTGVSVSPTGEFLATSHVDSLSLNLWVDRSLYGNVSLDGVLSRPFAMDDPSAVSEVETDPSDPSLDTDPLPLPPALPTDDPTPLPSLRPKAPGLITLSLLPKAHWHTLFHLELIKARNRPTAPPQAPPRAPFFLPTLHVDGQVEPTFAPAPSTAPTLPAPPAEEGEENDGFPMLTEAWSDDDDQENQEGGEEQEDEEEERGWGLVPSGDKQQTVIAAARNQTAKPTTGGSRILKPDRSTGHAIAKPSRSTLARLLTEEEKGWEARVTEHLLSLAPPQIDLEMQALCLGEGDEEGVVVVKRGLRYFKMEVRRRRHFEAMQSYLHRFLHLYSPLILQSPELRREVAGLREAQAQANKQMKELLQHNACLLGYLSNLHGF